MFTIIYNDAIMPVKFNTMLEAHQFLKEFLKRYFNNDYYYSDYTYYTIDNDCEEACFEICSL